MPAIALIVESGATPSSVTATLDLFRIAARIAPDQAMTVELLSASGGPLTLTEGLSITTRCLPPSLAGYGAVILPGFFAEALPDLITQLETVWQPTLARLAELGEGDLVAASCYGTFVLAQSGLLDGRRATTTWWLEGAFAERYPQVQLDAAQALVDAGPVITAGAMTAHTDLSLHVLRRLVGHAVARQVAAVMLVDESKVSQRPFVALQRHFADPLINEAVAWLEAHLAAPLATDRLAATLHVSYRTLHRRFVATTGKAPLAYLQALRIERAKLLLESSRQGVEQIAAAVGYEDASSFRRLFARLTSLSPARYRQQFRRG